MSLEHSSDLADGEHVPVAEGDSVPETAMNHVQAHGQAGHFNYASNNVVRPVARAGSSYYTRGLRPTGLARQGK